MSFESSLSEPKPVDLPVERGRTIADYEFRIVRFPPRTPIPAAKQLLTDEAEYGRWELARTRMYFGGERRVWLRRRIQRMQPTF